MNLRSSRADAIPDPSAPTPEPLPPASPFLASAAMRSREEGLRGLPREGRPMAALPSTRWESRSSWPACAISCLFRAAAAVAALSAGAAILSFLAMSMRSARLVPESPPPLLISAPPPPPPLLLPPVRRSTEAAFPPSSFCDARSSSSASRIMALFFCAAARAAAMIFFRAFVLNEGLSSSDAFGGAVCLARSRWRILATLFSWLERASAAGLYPGSVAPCSSVSRETRTLTF
mmetsp:Transcript_39908/g.93855  ORF Transcript_39908/g.93855 Transcript_39908/m.93855 type:complete len:233 (-) Transcript_39908:356-1054(-)